MALLKLVAVTMCLTVLLGQVKQSASFVLEPVPVEADFEALLESLLAAQRFAFSTRQTVEELSNLLARAPGAEFPPARAVERINELRVNGAIIAQILAAINNVRDSTSAVGTAILSSSRSTLPYISTDFEAVLGTGQTNGELFMRKINDKVTGGSADLTPLVAMLATAVTGITGAPSLLLRNDAITNALGSIQSAQDVARGQLSYALGAALEADSDITLRLAGIRTTLRTLSTTSPITAFLNSFLNDRPVTYSFQGAVLALPFFADTLLDGFTTTLAPGVTRAPGGFTSTPGEPAFLVLVQLMVATKDTVTVIKTDAMTKAASINGRAVFSMGTDSVTALAQLALLRTELVSLADFALTTANFAQGRVNAAMQASDARSPYNSPLQSSFGDSLGYGKSKLVENVAEVRTAATDALNKINIDIIPNIDTLSADINTAVAATAFTSGLTAGEIQALHINVFDSVVNAIGGYRSAKANAWGYIKEIEMAAEEGRRDLTDERISTIVAFLRIFDSTRVQPPLSPALRAIAGLRPLAVFN